MLMVDFLFDSCQKSGDAYDPIETPNPTLVQCCILFGT